MKRNVLILGSSGFIGRNLVEQLNREKYNLLTPKHTELDLLNPEKVEKYLRSHSIDVVISAVVIGGSRKEELEEDMLSKNLRMFTNIISNRKYYKKIIFFGSGAEYAKQFPIINVKEKDFGKHIPVDEYGLGKFICSNLIERARNAVNLRLFGVFGRYEDYGLRFISNAICKNILNLPITIKQNVYFDYLYIDDLVKMVDHFLTHKCGYQTYNIGRGEKIDLITIARLINKISKKPVEIMIKSKGLQNEYTCDTGRLRREMGKFEFTKIEDAIGDLYEWYDNNKSKIDRRLL